MRYLPEWLFNPFMQIYLTNVVWTCHIFEYNFGKKHKFTKYLKRSCRWTSDEQFSFKYFRSSTHSCLEIYLTNVVWTCHTFEDNFGRSINSQNIWRRVVDGLQMNTSTSNIFWILLLLKRYKQNRSSPLRDVDFVFYKNRYFLQPEFNQIFRYFV